MIFGLGFGLNVFGQYCYNLPKSSAAYYSCEQLRITRESLNQQKFEKDSSERNIKINEIKKYIEVFDSESLNSLTHSNQFLLLSLKLSRYLQRVSIFNNLCVSVNKEKNDELADFRRLVVDGVENNKYLDHSDAMLLFNGLIKFSLASSYFESKCSNDFETLNSNFDKFKRHSISDVRLASLEFLSINLGGKDCMADCLEKKFDFSTIDFNFEANINILVDLVGRYKEKSYFYNKKHKNAEVKLKEFKVKLDGLK